MIGTLLIIIPLMLVLIFIFLHRLNKYNGNYNDGYAFLAITFSGISAIIIIIAMATYLNTSSYKAQRDSLQSTLNVARSNGEKYETVTITREVMEFNRKLETDKNFYHKHFSLWINDDILELEPVK